GDDLHGRPAVLVGDLPATLGPGVVLPPAVQVIAAQHRLAPGVLPCVQPLLLVLGVDPLPVAETEHPARSALPRQFILLVDDALAGLADLGGVEDGLDAAYHVIQPCDALAPGVQFFDPGLEQVGGQGEPDALDAGQPGLLDGPQVRALAVADGLAHLLELGADDIILGGGKIIVGEDPDGDAGPLNSGVLAAPSFLGVDALGAPGPVGANPAVDDRALWAHEFYSTS